MHMSEGRALLKKLGTLMKTLEKAKEMTDIIGVDAMELGGEWEQEISTDILDLSSKIGEIIDDFINLIDEAAEISKEDDGLDNE